jgi:hypothetical protein
MAIYYVSAQTGDDSNNGTAVNTAKATVGAGENLAQTAGDIVYIAPGNYRETVTHGYGGSAGDRIYFIGDPDCEIFTNEQPGVVRITAATDENEFASANSSYIVRGNSKDYITWKNVHVDGGTGGVTAYNDNNTMYGFHANSSTFDYMETINCMAQSLDYGFYRMQKVEDCAAYHAFAGFSLCTDANRVLAFGCYYGAAQCTKVRNSILHGNWCCAYQCNLSINNILFGGYYQLLGSSNHDFAIDTMHMGGRHAIGAFNTTDTSQQIVSGSYVANAYITGRYAKIHSLKFGCLNSSQWSNNSDPVKGMNGSTDMQGDGLIWPQTGMLLYSINDARKIIEGFQPSLYSKAAQGGTITAYDDDAGAIDILGNPRKMGSTRNMFYFPHDSTFVTSSRDVGPFELSNVSVTSSYSSSAPAFKIEDEGIYRIPFTVPAGVPVTASVGAKHISGSDAYGDSLGSSFKSKLELRYSESNVTASAVSLQDGGAPFLTGSNLIIAEATSDTDDNTWSTLTVQEGPFPKAQELELIFRNNLTGSTSVAIFSDLEIT